MATNRATKSGINLDTQRKLEATYPKEDEVKVCAWMETITGESIGEDFFQGLHDGSYLCRLLNKLQPGLVPAKHEKPPTTTNASLRQAQEKENIFQYIEGCKKYGMHEKDLFVTLDLYELQNKNMVIASFVSLGRQAQTNGFQGPVLGPKTAEANPREFDELQQKQIRSEIGLQMGTNKVASQAGQTPYGFQRQIHDKRNNK